MSSHHGWIVGGAGVLLLSLLVGSCDDGPTEPAASYQLRIIGGDGQTGPVDSQLPRALSVQLLHPSGSAVNGARIAWSVEEEGGYVSTASSPSVTDAGGRVRVYRTLGHDAGLHGTTASLDVPGGPSVRFVSAAHVHGATRMAPAPAAPGDELRDTVLATLGPIRVILLDADDEPVQGVDVDWSAPWGGTLSASRSVTGADGIADVTLTLADHPGSYRVRASVRGLIGSPVEIEAIAEPGNPTSLVAVAGSGQVGLVGAELSAYVVRVTDGHENGVADIPIEWSVTAGDGSIISERRLTYATNPPDDGGLADATYLLGADGMHAVTASAPTLPGDPGVTFESRAVSAIIHVITLDYYGSNGNAFAPEEVTVAAGGTVAWSWAPCWSYWGYYDCSTSHDVTFEDDPNEPASSPRQDAGWHFRRFEMPGLYRYRCTEHSDGFTVGMVGTVRVE